ncbi:c-type cytochrome [Xanthomarina spongicola]|uniref:Cbb3-type cytochrome c oxidase subunit III n=1 Tax=Xanthomarina spongicola TaxID=570520 RepID=A0A316DUL8_9FLAO|nr:cytochrome c [Xanthomarina spongicola]PWK20889.1 cbb3-type cytochrome c oxidase subunit III [Xanthomarina spongicola]
MKSLIKITVIGLVFISFVSCMDDSRPNYQFMPNMYESVGYETYSESQAFRSGIEAQLPVEGTIARGYMPFEYSNTIEDFLLAKENLKSPIDLTQVNLEEAKILYDIYCGICHGTKGDGQGQLVKREKILGIPRYDDIGRSITEGSIYHSIYYGKNTMGSYANQLSEEESWQVVAYVLDLKAKLEK